MKIHIKINSVEICGKDRKNMTEEKEQEGWFRRFCNWREEHVSERSFILVLAFLVGFFAAVAAFVLHGLINQIEIGRAHV